MSGCGVYNCSKTPALRALRAKCETHFAHNAQKAALFLNAVTPSNPFLRCVLPRDAPREVWRGGCGHDEMRLLEDGRYAPFVVCDTCGEPIVENHGKADWRTHGNVNWDERGLRFYHKRSACNPDDRDYWEDVSVFLRDLSHNTQPDPSAVRNADWLRARL
jgi:hypothetical protein